MSKLNMHVFGGRSNSFSITYARIIN